MVENACLYNKTKQQSVVGGGRKWWTICAGQPSRPVRCPKLERTVKRKEGRKEKEEINMARVVQNKKF